MKNWEFYEEELKKYSLAFAMKGNQIYSCAKVPCHKCDFDIGESRICDAAKVKWLYQEYKEAVVLTDEEIDWTKVPVDTLILVKDSIGNIWKKRYFARYECGGVYAWEDGKTSYTTDKTTLWCCAKLADE